MNSGPQGSAARGPASAPLESPDPPYNERVLARFATPAHAGALAARYPVTATGEAAESANGCRVVLAAGSDRRVLCEVRFRVFGCPHLVAAAEEWCRRVEGRPAGTAAPEIAELMHLLAVPVVKTGRILLLEDAWDALLESLAAQSPQAATEPMEARGDQ